MKKCKPNKYGQKFCIFGFCAKNTVPAVCMTGGLGYQEYACEAHKQNLMDRQDSGYMTLADEMTWGRL